MAADTDTLIGTVTELAAARDGDREAIEDVLAQGYAMALSLDAERRRLETRIAALAAGLVSDGASVRVAEISDLARRRMRADGDLARLRAALGVLRARLRSA